MASRVDTNVNRRDERCPLAQAAAYVASAPKSNRVGTAYWAAMGDVQAHGSQQVPPHLLSAGHPLLKRHGIGVGYQYPHDYEGADVQQQYLPDALVDRVYYVPSDQGMETQIGARLDRLREARAEAHEQGGPRRAKAAQGDTRGKSPMRIADGVMKSREEVKRKTAEQQKRDAKGGA